MDAHIFPFNVTVAQVTDFTDPKPGRIHEGDHGFGLEVRKSGNKNVSVLSGWNKWQIGIKFPHGKLGWIPRFVQDVHGEETELGNTVIDGAVRKGTVFLKPTDKTAKLIPGDVIGLFVKDRLQIIEIRTDVSGIRFYSVVSKTAEGDHLPVSF